MVRLRKSHTKLKIALCSVCGFFVAIGGVLGIWVLSSALQGEKEVVRPEDTVSVRKELPSGGTYSELKSDGLDTLGYLAYVLDRQEFYHSESSTSSVAMIATQTTQSFKDYKDGIMLSSDFTYGFVSAGTQSCFVPDGNENGEGAGVYMRTSNGSVNSSSTGTNTNWNDDVRYYPEEEYLYTYGQYSTEMTVYILNDETVTSWDEVRDNGDGTYSQKFYLDAEKAAYYYQYAMKTRGGLDTLPIFKSVTLDITFDDSYRVLEIDAVEDTNITYIFSMDSTSTTTTTYSYDEVSFDQPHRDLYDAYYKDYVGKLQSGDNEEEQIDVISLLAGAFANVLNGQGQQFDATLTLGNTPYYGRVYLNVDMGGISSGDILGAIEARIQLSADRSFDSQDLYIEISDGKVSGYYSTGFALTADINSFGDIIDKFETWISTLDFGSSSDGGTDGEGEGEDQPDEGEGDSSSSLNDILEQLLGGLVLEESEGGVSVSLDISDLLGIGLSAKLDFTASEGADGTTEYSFASADIGGITYGGENIALSLGLTPSTAENILHDESETPFNVNEAADSLYQLLSSQTLKLRLSLEGAELADFASAIGIADPGDSLDNLKLEVEGGVALDGLTVNAAVRLIDTSAEKTLLDADVYYIYNGSSGAYGTAYLAITNLLGVECDAKVYCDIADLADTITKLVASFSGKGDEGSEEGGAAVLAEDGSDLVSVINGVLSLDFGSVIKELTANDTVIGATVNADEILALLGTDVTLGDITLEYSLGDFDAEDYNTEGGWLHGSVPSLGAEVYVYGSTLAIDEINFEEYLDLDVLLGSVIGVLSSETVTVDLTVTGGAVADILAGAGLADLGASLDGLTLNVSGGVSISSLPSALAARAKVNLTNGDLPYVVAEVFYAYEEGGMGTAYITITNLLGADLSASPVKVKCDISDAVTAIEQLIGAVEEVLPVAENGQSDGEGNDIASIISGVLAIDFGSIIKELTINADVLSTTIDADNLIAMFSDVSLGLGEVTLEYNTEGTLTGSALNGEVALEVSGSDSTLTAPDDSEFLDINEVLNTVTDILTNKLVALSLDLDETVLANLLKGVGAEDYVSLADGLGLTVDGTLDIEQLAALVNIILTRNEETLLAGQIYYDYNNEGYGTAQLYITNVFGAACDIKVKCDIAELAESIQQIIAMFSQSPSMQNDAPEADNTVVGIISEILEFNFPAIIEKLTANASGFETEIDVDALLGELEVTGISLGTVTLKYDTATEKLTGSALGGLTLEAYKGTITVEPIKGEFFDINEVLNTVTDILTNKLVALSLTLDETGLETLLKGVGAEDYVSLAEGLGLTVDGTLDIEQLAALVNIILTRNEETLLAGQIYYDYNNEGYGTAQLYITNILGATCDIKVKCDIAELAESIQQIIAMFTQSPSMQNDAPEADNTVVGIISEILELDFPAIIEKLTANASGFETEIDVDALLGELEVTGISLGTVTLKYDAETEKLTGSALGGLTLEAYRGTQEVEPIDGNFLDLNEVLNTVTDILTNKLVALSLTLDETGLANLLKGVGAEDYVSLAEGLGLTVDGTLDIEQLAALVNITLTRGEETLLAGQIYYDYDEASDGETSYGTAQLYITNVLGAECDIKVKCDIAELAESIQQIIAMFSAPDPNEPAPTSAPEADNTVVGIISEILELNFPAIIEKLTANASGFETEIDVDALLGELEVTGISLGTVTLKYDTATEKLTGSALGGLTLEAYKGTQEVKPIDGNFLDINDVLNTVKDILENKLVALSLNLDETGLETLLKGVGAEDYVSLADGLGLTVDGTLDIEQLAALVNITLTRNDSSILAGQIYYDYDEAAEGETSYGTAQLYITNVLGAACDIKVKCDIAELAESIQQIIAMFSAPDPNEPAPTSDPEADNTVVGIISEILEFDFPAIIEKLTANASGFETEIDVDALLGELEVTGISLGKVTLKYDKATEKLTGFALSGLTLEAYKGTQEVKPIDGNFLDINDVLNTVKDILENKLVALSLNLDETGLETLLKGVGAEDYVSLADGLGLTVDGTLDIEQLAALVNITLTRGEETLLAGQIYYEYTEAETDGETSYGTAQLYITNVFGATCDIKVKCDIAELAESIQQIIAMFSAPDPNEPAPTSAPEADNTVVGIISEILELNFPAIIEKLTANASGFETEIDVDALLGELEVTGISLGKVTLKYDTETEKLTGSALGGLTLEAYKGTQEVKPIDGEFLDINEVIEIALAVSEQVQAIINEEQIHFDIDAGAIIDGVAVGIEGSAAVDWVGGTLNKLAVTATLSLQNSGEANRSATAFTFLYNNGAADSDPYIRIGIGDEVLNITKRNIATVSAQIEELKVQIQKLIDAINGGSAQSDGEAEQIVAEIARLSGISAITVDGGDGGIKEPDAVIIINALLDALLGANENGENVLADIFGAIMSGTSVSADDLSLAVKMLFENIGASLSIGLDNGGRLSLGGTVTSGGAEVADLHISAKSGLGGVFEKIDGSLDELKQNSSSEEVSFIKIVYDYLFKAIGNVNIGDYLGSDAYKVSFRLGGDGSKIPELAGVQVTADLYFAGNYQGGNLIRADISNLTVDGFNLSADVVYLNNTLYIDLENIDGTALSGLKVQVQADDIYKAVENIIALIKNDKVINFFGSVAGSFRTSGGEGQDAAGAAVTLSEEQEKTFTDILVALLSLDYSEVVKISSADGATTITADIDAVLEAVGVDVSVGSAQIVAEKDRLTVGLSHENSNYNWIQLVAERSESLNFDTSSLTGYIDIGFVADIVDDAGKFITSNAPADGEISTLFTLNGGTIAADVDISDIDFSSALGDEWWSGIVGAVLKGLDIDPITISNIDLVIGLDSAGELYFSLEGDLSAVSVTALGFIPIEFVVANSIGITYSDGLITLKKDSGGSPIYWVMTPEYFIDNLFAEQSDENGTDSPIRWLLGTGSSIWNLIASNLGGLIDIDSGITSPDEITLYPVSDNGRDGGNEEATALSQFLAGYAIKLGEENAYTYGGYSAALERLGLKDSNNYYAFALNASGLTGGMLDALDVALLRDETYGFGGLKAYASVMSGAVVVNFNIGYSGYKAPTDSSVPANYYENAVGSLSDAERTEFEEALAAESEVTANINSADTVYAYDVFGGVKIEGGVLGAVNTQREYVDKLLTVTVYESEEDMEAGVNAATYKVRYGSVINLHDDWNIMSDDSGNVYVYVAADDTSGTYPETYTVEKDTVFYKTTVSGEEWTTAKVTINGQTFVVKHGTSLNDIVANKFGGYGVVGGWKQVMSDGTRQDYTATAVTEDVELEAQFARLSVTAENGVVYTLGGGTQGEGVNTVYDHYEVTGYTQVISAYYEENTTLVLENEVDGVPVTAIAANAFAMSQVNEKFPYSLRNVVVPENVTYVGGRAFLDNKGLETVVFLAESVYFDIDANADADADSQRYAFYGCTSLTNSDGSYDDTKTNLKIYFKNATTYDEGNNGNTWNDGIGVTNRRKEHSWSSPDYTRAIIYQIKEWAYLNISLTADIDGYATDDLRNDIVAYLAENGYAYNADIYNATKYMLVNVSGVSADSLKAEIENAVNLLVDKHTADVSGAINMYAATVEITAISGNFDSGFGGGVNINITVNNSGEAWYKVSCGYTLDGETSDVNTMKVEYEDGNSEEYEGALYVKAGSKIKFSSSNAEAYALDSVNVNGGTVENAENGVCEIIMREEVSNLVANYQTVGTPISIYSEVSFKYDGVTYENSSDGWYSVVLGEDVAELTYGVTAELPGYYFIGWAVMNGEALEFTSDLTVSENAQFYAIWAQNNSQNLTVSFEKPEANTSSLSDIAVTSEQGSFSAWYADGDFSKEAISELGANTVVYARLSFSLGFTISGEKTKYNVTMSYPNSSSETYWEEDATGLSTNDTNKIDWLADGIADSQGTAIVVLEGAYVEVSRGDSANVILINIYNVKDADVPLYSISVQGIKMSWRGIGSWGSWREDGDRAFFDGNSHFNSNECSANGFTMPNGYNIDGNNKVWLTSESVSQNLEFILTI